MKGTSRARLFLIALVLLLSMSIGVETVLADFSHVVRFGETLSSIGRRYGVNPYTIASVNGLANPNYIRAGQVLTIPSRRGGPAYWRWPGATTATPIPQPAPTPVPISVCISASEAWDYLGCRVCVEYYVQSAARDEHSGAVFLNSHSPFDNYFSAVIWSNRQYYCQGAAENYYYHRRIRVWGTVVQYQSELYDKPQIQVASCQDIQILQ